MHEICILDPQSEKKSQISQLKCEICKVCLLNSAECLVNPKSIKSIPSQLSHLGETWGRFGSWLQASCKLVASRNSSLDDFQPHQIGRR